MTNAAGFYLTEDFAHTRQGFVNLFDNRAARRLSGESAAFIM